jgi:hypothetical protein
MADIEQITKIDLELSTKMSAFDVKLDMIVDQNNQTNEHLKTLNGKVADQEHRLSDYGAFKKSVEDSAQKKARIAASTRSTVISVIVPIITILIVWLIERIFHFQLPTIQ